MNIGVAWPVSRLQWLTIITGVGLFALFVALFFVIQFSTPNLAGIDGYFHIKFAQVMRQQGLLTPFTWLPLTILNAEDFYDHHFLFHVLLIPFTFGDLRLGAKWAGIIFPASALLMGWIFLRGQRAPYAWLWALGFLGLSSAFLYRMSMVRVQAVSLLMLILILHVTLSGRYRWLLPLAFVYIWLYDAFILALIVVGAYVAMRWLLEQRFTPAPLLYAVAGVILGAIINPYFPNNFYFIYHHILPKLTETTSVGVGSEWFPYDTWTLAGNSGLALLAFMAGVFALGLNERRMETRTATVLVIVAVFGLMLFKSRRFVEYFPPFALIFCALAWAPLIETWTERRAWPGKLLPLGLAIVIGFGVWFNIEATRQRLQDTASYQKFAGAAAWLKVNTPPGSLLFQTDWDDFVRLYYHNTHNIYTLGLDPTYMQSYKPELYDLWRDITRGWVEKPGYAIAYTFGAGYVFTDTDHPEFLQQAETDPDLQEVYRDDEAIIFVVLSRPDKLSGEY